MAVATYDLGAIGGYTNVTVTCDGDVTAQLDSFTGAFELIDTVGDKALVQINNQESNQVFAEIAKADVDAIVVAVNAATP